MVDLILYVLGDILKLLYTLPVDILTAVLRYDPAMLTSLPFETAGQQLATKETIITRGKQSTDSLGRTHKIPEYNIYTNDTIHTGLRSLGIKLVQIGV